MSLKVSKPSVSKRAIQGTVPEVVIKKCCKTYQKATKVSAYQSGSENVFWNI